MAAKTKRLDAKEKAFIEAYLVDFNATNAAREAGYSDSIASQIGYRMLRKDHIKAAIKRKNDKKLKKFQITKEKILYHYSRIAFGSLKEVCDWTSTDVYFIPQADLQDDADLLISEISATETTHTTRDGETSTTAKRKIKMHDKLKALEVCAKHLGMFNDKLQSSSQRDSDADTDRILRAAKRVKERRDREGTAEGDN